MEAYLDNSSTTRISDSVLEKMIQVYRIDYGNPSAMHSKGFDAEKYIKEAVGRALQKRLPSSRKEVCSLRYMISCPFRRLWTTLGNWTGFLFLMNMPEACWKQKKFFPSFKKEILPEFSSVRRADMTLRKSRRQKKLAGLFLWADVFCEQRQRDSQPCPF